MRAAFKADFWKRLDGPFPQVWMRAAFKADFWKLHRVIDQDLKKGVYRLEVKGS